MAKQPIERLLGADSQVGVKVDIERREGLDREAASERRIVEASDHPHPVCRLEPARICKNEARGAEWLGGMVVVVAVVEVRDNERLQA